MADYSACPVCSQELARDGSCVQGHGWFGQTPEVPVDKTYRVYVSIWDPDEGAEVGGYVTPDDQRTSCSPLNPADIGLFGFNLAQLKAMEWSSKGYNARVEEVK